MGSVFNCAVILGLSKIICKAKVELCNAQEYYEERWFKSGISINQANNVYLGNIEVEFSNTLSPLNIKSEKYPISIGIEICEDAWAEVTPSMLYENVDLILNISASSDTIQSRESRKNMIKGISDRKRVPYFYVSGSNGESSSISLLRNIHIICDKSVYLEKYESNYESLTTTALIDFDAIRACNRQIGKRSNNLHTYLINPKNRSIEKDTNIYDYYPNN